MNETPLETEVVPQNQALAVRQEQAVATVPEAKQQITAAQAKVEAVAHLTMAAYEKAATLQLTPEESERLQADFPDEAFKTGAGGKDNLIYIEHAFLRDRFTQVFGMGQWAIIPRRTWNESFVTGRGTPGERVYVEAMLVVRGCFVGEAVGAMEYYPKNESQNYGDAVEGAKTAAFRRCAKEFGVGLQAWKKDWCVGWFSRQSFQKPSEPSRGYPTTIHTLKTPSQSVKAQIWPTVKPATEAHRAKMIENLKAGIGQPNRAICTEYFRKLENPAQLMPNEELEELPLCFVPKTPDEMKALAEMVARFGDGEQSAAAFQAGPIEPPAEAPKPTPKPKPVDRSGMEQVTGTIQKVTVKEGTSKKGPWHLYGIKIADGWINSFSASIGQFALEHENQEVTVWYTQEEKGRTAHDIEPAGDVPN